MIGIDWGTSTSSIARVADGRAALLPLAADGDVRIPSTAWIPREPRLDAPADESGRARALAPELVRRGALRFGVDATDALLADEDAGLYVKSPKSFLGADLRERQLEVFTALVARMLGDLLDRAATTLGARPTRAVIGRPVRYHGTRGAAGDAQAIGVMEAAAAEAGLEEVRFLLEPVAAAWAYEATLDGEHLVLVIDAGGGTTDLTLVRLDPARRDRATRDDDVLATAGDRVGGTDLDARLALRALAPALGFESLLDSGRPVPNPLFVDLCNVADVNAQARFASAATAETIAGHRARSRSPERLDRLARLQERRGALRFNRSAEAAKVGLTDAETLSADLGWLEPGLAPTVARADLAGAATPLLDTIGRLADEVTTAAGAHPDRVFVTGGTALSPVVAEGLRERLGARDLVVGDLFGSVASGLGLAASRIG
jgi:hypothetical chaperone protein